MFNRIARILSVCALLFCLPAQAANTAKTSVDQYVADATFDTLNGCEDDLVGVTVTQFVAKDSVSGPSSGSSVVVFGSFNDYCDFGNSSSFYGSVPLAPGEFSQGHDGATLEKTMTVSGRQLHLSLKWSGDGNITTDHSVIKQINGPTRSMSRLSYSSTSAGATGAYAVDGLNMISGNTVVTATLTEVRLGQNSTVK